MIQIEDILLSLIISGVSGFSVYLIEIHVKNSKLKQARYDIYFHLNWIKMLSSGIVEERINKDNLLFVYRHLYTETIYQVKLLILLLANHAHVLNASELFSLQNDFLKYSEINNEIISQFINKHYDKFKNHSINTRNEITKICNKQISYWYKYICNCLGLKNHSYW